MNQTPQPDNYLLKWLEAEQQAQILMFQGSSLWANEYKNPTKHKGMPHKLGRIVC